MEDSTRRDLDRLQIDPLLHDLVSTLWDHDYVTLQSCQGGGTPHNKSAYVAIVDGTGDGWFEANYMRYGLSRHLEDECCASPDSPQYCNECGTGRNGVVVYRGTLSVSAPGEQIGMDAIRG